MSRIKWTPKRVIVPGYPVWPKVAHPILDNKR